MFLCEPLINTAIELQAISRVHRIGQQVSTTVWMYIVANTVEKAIYDISVARRMSHISHVKGPNMSESNIEIANSLEIQEASLSKLLSKGTSGGEQVHKDLLWQCLFGQPVQPRSNASRIIEPEVNRHLHASAADSRLGQSGDSTVARR